MNRREIEYSNGMRVPWWQVDLGESSVSAVLEVAQNKSFSMGTYCAAFEDEIVNYVGSEFAIGVTSGSDALLIALLGMGIKSGDKVLVQDRSWIAAANAIALLGARPIFVDVSKSSPTLSLNDLKVKYSNDVKALVIVHMNGRHGEFEEILEFCAKKSLPIIEDAAQALGSNIAGKFLGTFGEIGCYSLSIAKIVGAGQGGFCVSDNQEIITNLKEIRTHGTLDTFAAQWQKLGFNFRLTDFHAAIASTQLPKLSERIIKAQADYEFYLSMLSSLDYIRMIPMEFEKGEVGPYIEAEVSAGRGKFIEYMQANHVDVRPFYPAISTAKHLRGFGDTPNALRYAESCLYLPSGPAITHDQITYVCNLILEYAH
jgi:dTDP-4-amino-4,6-dideoxygalactose transaminase